MRIIITGGPGTGKTVISAKLAKQMDIPLVDIKKIVNKNRIFEKKGKEKIVDVGTLKRKLLPLIKKNRSYILEGHLACEIKLPCDFVFVLRTNPKKLMKRLSKRGYSKKKIHENLLAEMLDYCTQRVETVYKKQPLELDTGRRSIKTCISEILNAIRKRKKKLDSVSYSQKLKAHLGLKK